MHPGAIVQQMEQRADELGKQLASTIRNLLELRRLNASEAGLQLRAANPSHRIARHLERARTANALLPRAMAVRLDKLRARCAESMRGLNAVSPLATLERGYAIVSDSKTGCRPDR